MVTLCMHIISSDETCFFRCIFTSIFDVKLEKASLSDSETNLNDPHSASRTPVDRVRTSSVPSGHGSPQLGGSSNTPVAARIDKRLTAIHVSHLNHKLAFHYTCTYPSINFFQKYMS